nr:MAG TPA: hypothetical protein [Caudoviricetes sp.]
MESFIRLLVIFPSVKSILLSIFPPVYLKNYSHTL